MRFGILGKLLIFSISMVIVSFSLIYIILNFSFDNYSNYVSRQSEELLNEKYRAELKSNTEIAVKLIENIYKQKKINSKEKLKLARKLIRPLRFSKEGYYFVYEAGTGKNLIHGAKKSLEGKKLWGLQDPDKTHYIIRELDKVARNNKIFHEYHWSKIGSDKLFLKLGTAMMVPGTNMWVGTGAYIDDINANKTIILRKMSKITRSTRFNFIMSFIIIGVISVIFIVILAKNMLNPVKNMIMLTKEIEDGNYDIHIKSLSKDEIGELANRFNHMIVIIKDYMENLENKVEVRTSKLQETMKRLNKSNTILETLSDKLSMYLDPQVRDKIFKGEQDVNVASKRKKLTVFFSDIKNFTQTTERLETEVLTDLLNHYLDEMSKIAIKNGATIDKYIGDAILIFFGDPESRGEKEDAIAAVSMAIEMRKRIKKLQQIWLDKGISVPFQVRMGINTGYCTVGNFGSSNRIDYTIIGSQVNLASRLETSAETDQILITHETYALIKDKIYCEKKDLIQAKGISYDVQTYKVLDFKKYIDGLLTRIEEHVDGFSLTANLEQIDKAEKKKILKTLKNTFNVIKEKF